MGRLDPKYIRLFPYYGSKIRLSGKYPEPEYDSIVEPFAGAAGYSSRYFKKNVTLIEKNPILVGVLRYLIHSSGDVISSLPLLGPMDDVRDLPICQEAKHLIGFWINNGVTHPANRPSAWMRSLYPNIPSFFWGERCRDRLADHVDRIKHWVVRRGDYWGAPNITATWFIDPPYQKAGKYYKENDLDYDVLSTWCKDRSGQVIVCENEGATWLPFEKFCDNRGAAKGRKLSKEVVWNRTIKYA